MAADLYLNRELSAVDYFGRILALAEDPVTPLLERAKYLAIFASLLDEFFQVRVAGLKDQLAAGLAGTGPDGLTPGEQLRAISSGVHARRRADMLASSSSPLSGSIPSCAAMPGIADW